MNMNKEFIPGPWKSQICWLPISGSLAGIEPTGLKRVKDRMFLRATAGKFQEITDIYDFFWYFNRFLRSGLYSLSLREGWG